MSRNRPIALYTPTVIMQKLDYVHNNPVAAGFVRNAAEWLYSSAADYSDKQGMLECMTQIDLALWDE